jgi:hypothetical protein
MHIREEGVAAGDMTSNQQQGAGEAVEGAGREETVNNREHASSKTSAWNRR